MGTTSIFYTRLYLHTAIFTHGRILRTDAVKRPNDLSLFGFCFRLSAVLSAVLIKLEYNYCLVTVLCVSRNHAVSMWGLRASLSDFYVINSNFYYLTMCWLLFDERLWKRRDCYVRVSASISVRVPTVVAVLTACSLGITYVNQPGEQYISQLSAASVIIRHELTLQDTVERRETLSQKRSAVTWTSHVDDQIDDILPLCSLLKVKIIKKNGKRTTLCWI